LDEFAGALTVSRNKEKGEKRRGVQKSSPSAPAPNSPEGIWQGQAPGGQFQY